MTTLTQLGIATTTAMDRERSVLDGERRILEMIATGVPWQPVLNEICRLFEAQHDDVRASIMLARDGRTLHPGAAPRLPPEYAAAFVNGAPIGMNQGSCGTAAYIKRRVIVEDIMTDPIWAAYAALVQRFGLRACFSTPIVAHDGEVLGTFGIYFLTPRRPEPAQLALADRATNLALIALDRRRTDLRLALLHEELEQRIHQRTEALERVVSELESARAAAERANAAKSRFLANMSHEIRTPISAMLGSAQLLADAGPLSASQSEHVATILSSGEHLLSMIDDVLDMAKIESGRVVTSLQTFDLETLLTDVERMFRLQAATKRIEFAVHASNALPRSVVSDPAKLRQVLINLVGNAIKFTHVGSVIVQVSGTLTAGATGFALRVAVTDTGPGIHLRAQSELFQPFVQLPEAGAPAGGTGLGLAISKRLVELLGGRIGVESVHGHGSTFWFELPVERSPARPLDKPRALPDPSGAEILVVDDHDPNRRVLVELLRPLGMRVLEATNGAEALIQFERHRPKLVLMDMRMPVMDGYEAMRRIRLFADSDEARIVAITASALDEDTPEIRRSGADDVLHKPYRHEALLEMVSTQLASVGRGRSRLPQQQHEGQDHEH